MAGSAASARPSAATRSQGESIGINVKGTRVGIFAVGSAIGGLGGVLLGIEQGAIGISDFALLIGLVWLAVVVTVGVRGFQGALVAGLMFTIFPALFQYVHVTGSASCRRCCSASARSAWPASHAASCTRWRCASAASGRRHPAGRTRRVAPVVDGRAAPSPLPLEGARR